MDISSIVIVGAGQAGAGAVAQLRLKGYAGRIVLVGDESHPPYERPPLSKDVLLQPERTRCTIHPSDFYETHRVELRLGTRVTALDAAARRLTLSDGSTLDYDRLLLATGATVRRLPLLDALGQGVYTLRTLDDARALLQELRPGRRILLVGGGVIGLELASSAVELGAQVSLVEQAALPMARTAPPLLSEYLCDVHRARGVALHLNARLASATREGDTLVLTLQDGTRLQGDAIVYGIGVEPDVALARQAGLVVDNGICVDAHCRSSDPSIYAAGDVAAQGGLRRETWENANHQASVAAHAMLGLEPPADPVPWYWTDQCDLNIQFAGDMAARHWLVRGTPGMPPFMLFGLDDEGVLTAAITINQGRDMRSAKELMARRARLPAEVLTDPQQSLRNLSRHLPEA
ncbi:phenylpropionate dioxygenase ferredoxin reductase subunit [Lampropedia hyalina DSM 16112]|jgi:3-phenylpropionate/trans-cinnamate dioxygenase ferredoxin reductase subunit|uniref:Phenylpropionate dioxygenase ferredoxin reductase subunit n=1 Tax=Lampropedia hyalina DSM 16112 TaxID=1122156 RepID=A0A1M4U114_9BURK|nr:3-phenylpropionate/cinnamic acid dioxygenase ferredoxin--NAD(+) reductase subunit [Lampropedia hyalina]SHE50390.1 phenylpropionate dioxygenase ferredoxin reductase subunit [Lampropedia hyalina DSM 16112]